MLLHMIRNKYVEENRTKMYMLRIF